LALNPGKEQTGQHLLSAGQMPSLFCAVRSIPVSQAEVLSNHSAWRSITHMPPCACCNHQHSAGLGTADGWRRHRWCHPINSLDCSGLALARLPSHPQLTTAFQLPGTSTWAYLRRTRSLAKDTRLAPCQKYMICSLSKTHDVPLADVQGKRGEREGPA